MVVGNPTVRVDDDDAVEDRAAGKRAVHLLIAGNNHNLMFLGGGLQRGQALLAPVDAIGKQARVELIGLAHVRSRHKAPDESGVSRKPRLGKYDHAAAVSGGLGHKRYRPFNGPLEIQINRWLLDYGDFHRATSRGGPPID